MERLMRFSSELDGADAKNTLCGSRLDMHLSLLVIVSI